MLKKNGHPLKDTHTLVLRHHLSIIVRGVGWGGVVGCVLEKYIFLRGKGHKGTEEGSQSV